MRYLLLVMITFWGFSSSLLAQQIQFLHPKVLDMGEVLQGNVIEGEIKFVNTGDGVVEIEKIKPSCGCTTVPPGKMNYASGDTAVIPFKINTKSFQGIIRKSIKITFKNVEPKSELIIIQANVLTEVKVAPRFLNFQSVPFNPDTTFTQFLEIENTSKKPVNITKIYTKSPYLKIIPTTATIPPGKSQLIRVELNPAQPGRLNNTIKIETDHPTQKQFTIPVFIFVQQKKS
ncbi:MAG: DUF1573 domain-containing protein [Calditrichaeota bacterium]|nr:MAG: DUF1573 domain-containing protein [Calditrichota bacterium]